MAVSFFTFGPEDLLSLKTFFTLSLVICLLTMQQCINITGEMYLFLLKVMKTPTTISNYNVFNNIL